MKANHITQISGISGQLFGVVPVQTNGTVTLKIVGDTLQFRDETFFGLETKEVFIPIQEVRAIEIGEGCTWWLFWLGLTLVFGGIGIIFIVLAFIVKQRYIIIYTSKLNLIVFYKKSEKVGSFRAAVLEARQSKPATIPKQPPPPPPPRPLEN